MVAESVAAKIFKIGSVVFELWPFYQAFYCSYFFLLFPTFPTFLFWSYFFLLFLQILLLFLLFHKKKWRKKSLCFLINWSKIEIYINNSYLYLYKQDQSE